MVVKVLFFGVLAEVTGTSVKHYHDVSSVNDVKIHIQDDYPEVVHYNYRIAVNSEITDDNVTLKEGDELVFMPPFAGG